MTEMEKLEAANIAALATPALPLKFPPPPTQEQIDRLAQLERELVDYYVSRPNPGELSMKILVLRAEMYG